MGVSWMPLCSKNAGQPRNASVFSTVIWRSRISSPQHDWYADAGALTLFSHWITPPSEPRRYNTHFFFAAAPADQAALADADEMHDGIWIGPTRALEQYRNGTMHLVYPTIKHLERLANFDSIEAALAYAKSKPIVTIMPADAGEDFAIPPLLEGAW